jgi:molybdate transport system substrate-binding protein
VTAPAQLLCDLDDQRRRARRVCYERDVTIEIRSAERDDVASVVALVTEILAEFGLPFGNSTDDALLHLPESYAAGAFWVAFDGDTLLGTCGVYPVGPATFELRKMYLRPASRGLGLGKRLLDVAVAWARERGATKLVLDTTEQMGRAIAFYEAHGFVRDDTQIRGARCSRGYARLL